MRADGFHVTNLVTGKYCGGLKLFNTGAEMSEVASARMTLKYSGDGLEMALIMLKNLFLTIITLGIYRPWAVTNMRRYVWGHINFMDDRAIYTGTGKELFRGWIKLFAILIGAYALAGILSLFVPFAGILILAAYVFVFGLAIYSGLRYRLSRTLWRQIRFGADKNEATTKEFLKMYFLGVILCMITLGIYIPWFRIELRKYLTNKSRFGSSYFSFDGVGTEYAGIFWSSLLLSIVTLGIYIPWMIVNLAIYRAEHTSFQGKRFTFTLKGLQLLGFGVAAYLLTVVTIGIAAPWMFNWGLKLFVENIHLDGPPDLALVTAAPSDGSAMADDIVSGYDLDIGF